MGKIINSAATVPAEERTFLTIRMHRHEYERLSRLAAAEDLSRAAIVRRIIRRWMDAQEKEG